MAISLIVDQSKYLATFNDLTNSKQLWDQTGLQSKQDLESQIVTSQELISKLTLNNQMLLQKLLQIMVSFSVLGVVHKFTYVMRLFDPFPSFIGRSLIKKMVH